MAELKHAAYCGTRAIHGDMDDPRVVRWRETPWDDVMWLHERHARPCST